MQCLNNFWNCCNNLFFICNLQETLIIFCSVWRESMFLRTKPSGNRIYVQLVESVRKGSWVRLPGLPQGQPRRCRVPCAGSRTRV